jgi:hypothetical protein
MNQIVGPPTHILIAAGARPGPAEGQDPASVADLTPGGYPGTGPGSSHRAERQGRTSRSALARPGDTVALHPAALVNHDDGLRQGRESAPRREPRSIAEQSVDRRSPADDACGARESFG